MKFFWTLSILFFCVAFDGTLAQGTKGGAFLAHPSAMSPAALSRQFHQRPFEGRSFQPDQNLQSGRIFPPPSARAMRLDHGDFGQRLSRPASAHPQTYLDYGRSTQDLMEVKPRPVQMPIARPQPVPVPVDGYHRQPHSMPISGPEGANFYSVPRPSGQPPMDQTQQDWNQYMQRFPQEHLIKDQRSDQPHPSSKIQYQVVPDGRGGQQMIPFSPRSSEGQLVPVSAQAPRPHPVSGVVYGPAGPYHHQQPHLRPENGSAGTPVSYHPPNLPSVDRGPETIRVPGTQPSTVPQPVDSYQIPKPTPVQGHPATPVPIQQQPVNFYPRAMMVGPEEMGPVPVGPSGPVGPISPVRPFGPVGPMVHYPHPAGQQPINQIPRQDFVQGPRPGQMVKYEIPVQVVNATSAVHPETNGPTPVVPHPARMDMPRQTMMNVAPGASGPVGFHPYTTPDGGIMVGRGFHIPRAHYVSPVIDVRRPEPQSYHYGPRPHPRIQYNTATDVDQRLLPQQTRRIDHMPHSQEGRISDYQVSKAQPVVAQTQIHTPVFVTSGKQPHDYKYTVSQVPPRPQDQKPSYMHGPMDHQQPPQLLQYHRFLQTPGQPMPLPMINLPMMYPQQQQQQQQLHPQQPNQYYQIPVQSVRHGEPQHPSQKPVRDFFIPPYMHPYPVSAIREFHQPMYYDIGDTPVIGQPAGPAGPRVVSVKPPSAQGKPVTTVTIEEVSRSESDKPGDSSEKPSSEERKPEMVNVIPGQPLVQPGTIPASQFGFPSQPQGGRDPHVQPIGPADLIYGQPNSHSLVADERESSEDDHRPYDQMAGGPVSVASPQPSPVPIGSQGWVSQEPMDHHYMNEDNRGQPLAVPQQQRKKKRDESSN